MGKIIFDTNNYTDIVKFQVGQRIKVDIKEIPIKDRDTTTGVIIGIRTRFPATPNFREILYEVLFDNKGNYIKKGHRFTEKGIGPNQWFNEKQLINLE